MKSFAVDADPKEGGRCIDIEVCIIALLTDKIFHDRC